MNRLKIKLFLLLLALPVIGFSQRKSNEYLSLVNNIIPKPVSVKLSKEKTVVIGNTSVIVADSNFLNQAQYLAEQLQSQCGLRLHIKPVVAKNESAIQLAFDSKQVTQPEMYLLSVKDNRIVIRAKDVAGLVHGIQTLLQLLPLQHVQTASVSPVEIEDYPRFRYRGMHLDVSRHFFPVSFIKKYIDYISFHKFNTFHWHLTDDQGWRIEVKSYPRLTSVGAWRDSTLIGHFRATPARYDGIPYGGFYTQEEVKDVIQYAAIRGITIVPEIDIPGHSRAAIAAYPEFSTSPDTAWQVATTWGTYNRKNNVLAPNEKTFAFLKSVFSEVADLFPSPYVHIGGDECSKIWWKADPGTQAFIKAHGLKDEQALQLYFIEQAIETLHEKGKKVIGWDEILEDDLDTSAIIMNWRGVKAAITAAENGHNVIMTPDKYLYFNYYQSKNRDTLAIGGHLPLDSVYLFEPIPKAIAEQGLSNRVLGAQGNVWTEYIPNFSRLEYMIFPRLTALSEVLWTDSRQKDYNDFKRRLKESAIPRYLFWNSSYFKDYDTPGKK